MHGVASLAGSSVDSHPKAIVLKVAVVAKKKIQGGCAIMKLYAKVA